MEFALTWLVVAGLLSARRASGIRFGERFPLRNASDGYRAFAYQMVSSGGYGEHIECCEPGTRAT